MLSRSIKKKAVPKVVDDAAPTVARVASHNEANQLTDSTGLAQGDKQKHKQPESASGKRGVNWRPLAIDVEVASTTSSSAPQTASTQASTSASTATHGHHNGRNMDLNELPPYRPKRCRNGPGCTALAKGRCKYDHGPDYKPRRPVCRQGENCSLELAQLRIFSHKLNPVGPHTLKPCKTGLPPRRNRRNRHSRDLGQEWVVV